MKQAIVIGASGNLGRSLTNHLAFNGVKVLAITRTETFGRSKNIEELSGDFNNEALIERLENLIDKNDLKYVFSVVGSFSNQSYEETSVPLLLVQISNNVGSIHGICQMLVTKVLKQNLHLQFVFIGAKSSFDITQAVHYPAYNLAKHLLYQYVKMLREILKQNSSNLTIIAPEKISNEASSSENDINSEQLAHLLVNLASNQIDATHIFSVLTIEKKQLVELKIT